MDNYADKQQKPKRQSATDDVSKTQSGNASPFYFVDNRPGTAVQRKLIAAIQAVGQKNKTGGINDDPSLEKEADAMGRLSAGNTASVHSSYQQQPVQRAPANPTPAQSKVIQRMKIDPLSLSRDDGGKKYYARLRGVDQKLIYLGPKTTDGEEKELLRGDQKGHLFMNAHGHAISVKDEELNFLFDRRKDLKTIGAYSASKKSMLADDSASSSSATAAHPSPLLPAGGFGTGLRRSAEEMRKTADEVLAIGREEQAKREIEDRKQQDAEAETYKAGKATSLGDPDLEHVDGEQIPMVRRVHRLFLASIAAADPSTPEHQLYLAAIDPASPIALDLVYECVNPGYLLHQRREGRVTGAAETTRRELINVTGPKFGIIKIIIKIFDEDPNPDPDVRLEPQNTISRLLEALIHEYAGHAVPIFKIYRKYLQKDSLTSKLQKRQVRTRPFGGLHEHYLMHTAQNQSYWRMITSAFNMLTDLRGLASIKTNDALAQYNVALEFYQKVISDMQEREKETGEARKNMATYAMVPPVEGEDQRGAMEQHMLDELKRMHSAIEADRQRRIEETLAARAAGPQPK